MDQRDPRACLSIPRLPHVLLHGASIYFGPFTGVGCPLGDCRHFSMGFPGDVVLAVVSLVVTVEWRLQWNGGSNAFTSHVNIPCDSNRRARGARQQTRGYARTENWTRSGISPKAENHGASNAYLNV